MERTLFRRHVSLRVWHQVTQYAVQFDDLYFVSFNRSGATKNPGKSRNWSKVGCDLGEGVPRDRQAGDHVRDT